MEKGERITVARAGKPVARLVPAESLPPGALPPEDSLLNLDQFGFDGPGGPLPNEAIDRAVHGY